MTDNFDASEFESSDESTEVMYLEEDFLDEWLDDGFDEPFFTEESNNTHNSYFWNDLSDINPDDVPF